MNRTQIEVLLNEVREGRIGVNQALDRLRDLPFEDIGFAKLDHHRALRTGMPEVIFAAGKTAEQVATIFARNHFLTLPQAYIQRCTLYPEACLAFYGLI